MKVGTRRRAPWAWTALIVLATIWVATFNIRAGQGDSSAVILELGWAIIPVMFSGLAALIATRQPGNLISRLLFISATSGLFDAWVKGLLETKPSHMTPWLYLLLFLQGGAWIVMLFPIFHILFVFPTGRLLSPKWRWVLWVEAIWIGMFAMLSALIEEVGPIDESWSIDNPIGVIPVTILEGTFGIVWGAGLMSLALGGVVALVIRYRRSPNVVRAQIKWVLYAAAIFGVGYSVTFLAETWGESGILGLGFVASIMVVPVAMTMAILKYRLFDIDLIIRRTASYALIVGVLAAVYLGVVTGVSSLLPAQSDLAVVASTLAVAALFAPIRRRTQGLVDRRFNRSAFDGQLMGEALSRRLQGHLDPAEVAADWADTVDRAFHPAGVQVWIRPTDRD